MITKIIILLLCAILKTIGELRWHNAQRYIMPLIIGIGVSYFTGIWWLGLTVLPMIGSLVMGYGEKSPLKHSLGDASARAMWLFMVCALCGLGCALTGHLSWFIYVPWCLMAGVIGATTRNLWNVVIAPIVGAWIGLIVFMVK